MKKLAILLLVVAATAHADSDPFFDRLKAGGSPESIEGIDKAKAFVEKTSAECLNNPNIAACAKRDELAAQFAKAGICYWPGDQQGWMTCGEYNRKAEEWNADLRARRAKQQDELQKLAPVGMLFWSDFSPPVAGQRDPTIVPMACRKFNVKPDNPKNTAISMNRPGFIVNESKGRGIGCLFSDKSGQAMVQWIETGNIDKVNSPRIKPPMSDDAVGNPRGSRGSDGAIDWKTNSSGEKYYDISENWRATQSIDSFTKEPRVLVCGDDSASDKRGVCFSPSFGSIYITDTEHKTSSTNGLASLRAEFVQPGGKSVARTYQAKASPFSVELTGRQAEEFTLLLSNATSSVFRYRSENGEDAVIRLDHMPTKAADIVKNNTPKEDNERHTGNGGGQISNGAPTRADVDASFNQPRFDQYGRPMKSVNELCAEAKAAGGPVTPICGWNQWAKPP